MEYVAYTADASGKTSLSVLSVLYYVNIAFWDQEEKGLQPGVIYETITYIAWQKCFRAWVVK